MTTFPRWITTITAAVSPPTTRSSATPWRSSPVDSLLTLAFQLLAQLPVPADRAIRLVAELATASERSAA